MGGRHDRERAHTSDRPFDSGRMPNRPDAGLADHAPGGAPGARQLASAILLTSYL
ncbi:MFS transporter [Burkholderia thailandensis]|nr:MFS transporter [Burkholderia thailandensis]AWY59643.1 MFS transporter [Burkholderia thailandensis]AWY69254.1 MFS transporter [Burkholderia thailandensis]NOK42016.1 MFS transporter [Burkholderia thailandensis]NOK52997.1 MFS transporter [Burkholderia thailandensis]